MSRTAPRVHQDQAVIERLKQLQAQLDAELVVQLQLADGSTLSGTVPERPSVQQFLDAGGNEGTNGQLLIDTGARGRRTVWLDQVLGFTRLGSC